VSISGDTLVVGAYQEDGGTGDPAGDAGAAYIFARNRGGSDNWGQVKILHASDMQASDCFGWSVSISGDTLVVGAYGEAGGPGNPAASAGTAYVYSRNQGGADNWGEVKILHASDMQAGDCFGYAVSISGDILAVGAPLERGGPGDPVNPAGAAYVFERNQGGADNWGQVKILHASDMQVNDWFGWPVSISGDMLAVGAYKEDGGAGNPAGDAGAAYVFARNQGGADNWGEVKILHASDMESGDAFGCRVSISGTMLVVGAYHEDGGAGNPAGDAGAAYIFARNQGGADNWGQVKILHASDMQGSDSFGSGVSISGDTLVVGANYEGGGAGNPAPAAGAAYVFENILDPNGDNDGDSVVNSLDCGPFDPGVWAVPSEAWELEITKTAGGTLYWYPPSATGGSTVVYDVLRSTSASNFASATCIATGITLTTATDSTAPANAFFYLVRSRNACGGNLGTDSGGTPRTGKSCP